MMTHKEAGDVNLNEQEAALVGHPAGTRFKDLPGEALRFLATWYFDRQLERDFDSQYCGQIHCGNWPVFFARRFATLSLLMGKAFDIIEAEKTAEWIRACEKADAAVRALPPCTTCGRSRRLVDDYELCGACAAEKWKCEHPFEAEKDEDFEDIPF
jgi:hypothetical protein